MSKRWDCLVIGAGAAGIGMGTVLKELGLRHYAILERHSIGASFGMWPDEMRLITPSFTSNAYGMLDLNAVALNTSPAYTLSTEHPTGKEYAKYLQALSDYHELPVHCGIEVTAVQQETDGFCVKTSTGDWHARFVIWAAGEFQYPRLGAIPGSEYAIHNSQVTSWAALEGEQVVVIGGYESGTDAAIHLSRSGKKVTMLDRRSRLLDKGSSDPSMELSPYTKDRLRHEIRYGRISFIGGCEVQWIEPEPHSGYNIYCEDDHGKQHVIHSEATPILATGFSGSLHLIEHLIQRSGNGAVMLGPADESLITPGLFVSGPSVMHDQLMFCFIYKFRQRFAVIAHRIGTLLQYDVSRLEHYRREGMFLDDLSCCQENCTC